MAGLHDYLMPATIIAHRPLLYILDDDGEPEYVDTQSDAAGFVAWALWMGNESKGRRVLAIDAVTALGGEAVRVSTMFIGIDSRISGRPLLWETAVFWPCGLQIVGRAATAGDAAAMHASTLESIQKGLSL